MKKDCYELKYLKHDLRQKREAGIKVLEWKLTAEKKEYIENLGYRVEPYLYEIKTKKFYNVRNLQSTLLKDLHYKNKRGKKGMVRALKRGDKQILDEYGIRYYPVKYRIYLR